MDPFENISDHSNMNGKKIDENNKHNFADEEKNNAGSKVEIAPCEGKRSKAKKKAGILNVIIVTILVLSNHV